MIRRVKKTIDEFRLLDRGDGVVVAVSGGPDSVALLNVLSELAPQYGADLIVCHLNHGLRGVDSDREEAFVSDLSRTMGLPFTSRKTDVRSMMGAGTSSLEDACRDARYGYLEEVRRSRGFQKIALGHHLDDQAETVLMRFLRGSGSEGLKGMVPLRDGIFIRPLIEITRREILSFLQARGILYILDGSNAEDICLRNRIRRRLMPDLAKGYNPRLVENIGRTAKILMREDDYLRKVTEEILLGWGCAGTGEESVVPIGEFRNLHDALQGRIVKTLLLKASARKVGVGYRQVRAVLRIVAGERPDAFLDMPFGVRVRREKELLLFERKAQHPAVERKVAGKEKDRKHAPDFCYAVRIPGEIEIREAGYRLDFQFVEKRDLRFDPQRKAFLDFDGVDLPLLVRNWHPGDRMEPFGMKGTKKIQDIFTDEKVEIARRRTTPLIVDGKSVLWVAGIRMSERVRIKDETNRVLKIEII